MNTEKITYIRSQLQAGTTEAALVETLRADGDTEEQIASLLLSAREGGDMKEGRRLPPFSTLIKTAIAQVMVAKYLVALYFVGFVLQYYATFVLESTDTPALPEFILSIGAMLGSWVLLIVLSIATIQSFSRLSEGQQFSVHLQAAWPMILSVWWVILLTILVLFGGFLLFIIFGVILFVYLTFTLQARIIENYRGMSALNRSLQIVKGNWWGVALKGLGATVVGLMVAVTGGALFGIVLGLAMIPQDIIALAADFLVGPLFGALYAVFIHSVIVQMYMALLPRKVHHTTDSDEVISPVQTAPKTYNAILYFFAAAGLFMAPLAVFVMNSLLSATQDATRALESTQKNMAMMSLLLLQSDAELYLSRNEYSYSGFCDMAPIDVDCVTDDFNYRFVAAVPGGGLLCLSSLHSGYEVQEVDQVTDGVFTCE